MSAGPLPADCHPPVRLTTHAGAFARATTQPGLLEAALVCAALSTLLLLSTGYVYGSNTQTEQLPLVLRMLDPAYLPQDFYVNTSAGFGPRYYYCRLLAALATLAPLPAVMFALVWVSNTLVGVATYFAARRLTGSARTGILAAVLVLGCEAFDLGGAAFLVRTVPIPQLAAMPLALLVLAAGLAARPFWAAAAAAPCTLLHPLIGPGVTALVLGPAVVINLAAAIKNKGHVRAAELGRAIENLTALALVGGFTWLAWHGMTKPELASAAFVDLYAHFRNPHHCTPSSFPVRDYAQAAAFLVATLLLLRTGRTRRPAELTRILTGILAALLLACAAGYMFVEIWPTRIVATAQPFRFLFVLKWIGLLLTADAAVHLTLHSQRARSGVAVVAMAAVLALAAATGLARGESVRFAGALLVGLGVLAIPSRAPRRLFALGLCAVLITTATLHARGGVPVLWRVLGNVPCALTLDAVDGRAADIARQAARLSAPDAIFVTPPGFGLFRLVAGRAIVVDFKEYPFDDSGLCTWRARLESVYGPLLAGGSAAIEQMTRHYRTVTDEHLWACHVQFGATHAVLYRDTPTSAPVLAENSEYKVIALTATSGRAR
jgi:hypothetical protein